ncbi:apolipoprotein N-acyltransferase [Tropicimonas sp. IMCC34011]|uniref:apolipoprotein N-acyltransferase n=1 Tax=Tropicimonas sp. IMCC34011 TaxID=2248759 RepID=UPI000E25629D|nr:apolipoprotein N-acyltransferase [Tropicimonas sp. IMCC34011]
MDEAVRSDVPERPWRTRLACLAVGIVAATGQAPLSWPWLSLAAFAVAIWLISGASHWRSAAFRGWLVGTGYFAASLHWIVEPFLIDIARHGWMAPFALLFCAIGFALFWGGAGALAGALGRGRAGRAAHLVLWLTAAEMLRSVLWTGFPWALIGHIWIGAPQMQIAALGGPHLLTLLTLAAAALPALLGRQRIALGAIAGAALAAAPAAYGIWRVPAGAFGEPQATVRLVQPNARQEEKWIPERARAFFQRSLELTAAAPPGPAPDLVLWPETSIPWLLEEAGAALQMIAEASGGRPVALGVQRIEGAAYYNSLVVLDGQGGVTDLYDKHHLVPFGEYMPMASLAARVGLFGLAAGETGGYAFGPGPRLIDIPGAGRALPLICYEAIFPNDVAAAPSRPDWLMQVTNDAWFGQISGPYQHLAQARLRAVEQGLPLARAANTGVSAMIDPFGRVTGALGLGEAGFLDAALPAPLPPTPYARMGDWPVRIALILSLTMLLLLSLRKRERS